MDDVYSTSENKYTFGIFNGQKLTNWIEDFKTWKGNLLKTNMRDIWVVWGVELICFLQIGLGRSAGRVNTPGCIGLISTG